MTQRRKTSKKGSFTYKVNQKSLSHLDFFCIFGQSLLSFFLTRGNEWSLKRSVHTILPLKRSHQNFDTIWSDVFLSSVVPAHSKTGIPMISDITYAGNVSHNTTIFLVCTWSKLVFSQSHCIVSPLLCF